jgi:Uncharacterized protein conserved in bacteria
VGSSRRLAQFPDVPTVAESGVPKFEAVSWFGLFAPSQTPGNVVRKINSDVQKVFADREFQEKFLAPSFLEVIPGDPNDFSAYIKAEAAKVEQGHQGRKPESRVAGRKRPLLHRTIGLSAAGCGMLTTYQTTTGGGTARRGTRTSNGQQGLAGLDQRTGGGW